MSFDWKLMLKEQQDDLARMERLDAAMNMDQNDLDEDITSILKRPAGANIYRQSHHKPEENTTDNDFDVNPSARPSSSKRPSSAKRTGSTGNLPTRDHGLNLRTPRESDFDMDDHSHSPIETSRSSHDLGAGGPSSPDKSLKGAPDTNARIQKARLKGLTKQLEDSKDLRKQLQDQISDLQKQLKCERDENKMMKKRINLLETDQRRGNTPRGGRSQKNEDSQSEVSDLQAQVAQLKRELQTAERLVKQSEAQIKTKDTHLKRATETINRNKAQIDDFAAQLKGTDSGDRAKLDEAQARIRMLEKHREELVEGFKKQMKLIDVLKRQKTHMEAARLLQFTEEEFVKTLDWAV